MNDEQFQARIKAIESINELMDANNIVINHQLNRMQKLDIFHKLSNIIKELDDPELNKQVNQFYYEIMRMSTPEILSALSQIAQYLGSIH